MHGKIIEHFEGEGDNVVLIIPLVLFEKFRNSIIPLQKKIKLNKKIFFFWSKATAIL